MKHKLLLKNTVMLYILTFSNYFFSFITVPYQTRILGPEIYGNLGFAMSFATYIQLFLDFGFILSSTEEVARNKDNKAALKKILTGVTLSKLALGVLSFLVVCILCVAVDRFQQDVFLYELYFLWMFINSFLPDYLYRGLEEMSIITYRTVAVKFFFTIMIFILLKNERQYYVVPILNAVGALGAVIWAYVDLYRRKEITFIPISKEYFWYTLKRSSSYFVSRIATTLYGATNTFILGFLYPIGNTVGYYTSAEKLVTTARSAFSPIADSLYPYMVKHKDFKLVKKILLILMPMILAGCFVVWLFAEPICVLLFGERFRGSGEILRLLIPMVAITLPSYIFGFPVLSPMGLAKYANISTIVGAIIQVINLLLLFLLNRLNVKTMCVATCITEFIVLFFRVIVVLRNHSLLNESISLK